MKRWIQPLCEIVNLNSGDIMYMSNNVLDITMDDESNGVFGDFIPYM